MVRGVKAANTRPTGVGGGLQPTRSRSRGGMKVAGRGEAGGVRDEQLRGEPSHRATPRQIQALAAFVAAGGSVAAAAELVGVQPSTMKRHLADLRARSGLTTEQLIYAGRAAGWLVVETLEPGRARGRPPVRERPSRPTRYLRSATHSLRCATMGPTTGGIR